MTDNSENSVMYLSKDASSQSYGISLRTVYNNYLESTVYLNASNFDYVNPSFYDDGYVEDNYRMHNIRHLQLNVVYHPIKYIENLNYGLLYSRAYGTSDLSNLTNYNFKIGVESQLINNFSINLDYIYNIKIFDTEKKRSSDSFIRANIKYNIL